jgi:hypothetical protein
VIVRGFSGLKAGTWRECDYDQPAMIPAPGGAGQFWSGHVWGPARERVPFLAFTRAEQGLRADWSEFEDHMDTLLVARSIPGNGPAGPAARLRQATGLLGRPARASADTYSVADGEAAHGRA